MKISDFFMKESSVSGSLAKDKCCVDIKAKFGKRVSKKFYADLNDRVRRVMIEIGCGHDAHISVKMVIDRYLFNDTLPDLSELITVRMVFALLKPEIDRAIKRSHAARERAIVRRSAKSVSDLGKEVSSREHPDQDSDQTAPEAIMNDAVPVEAGNSQEKPEISPCGAGVDMACRQSGKEIVPENEPVIDKGNTAVGAVASKEAGGRPLNRRERRKLQRMMRQVKKHGMLAGESL